VPVIAQRGAAELRRGREDHRRLRQAREGQQAQPERAQGGTFTISNGGIYGSMMSTPIVNPPQSGILGCTRSRTAPWSRRQVVFGR
jgi:pyruvate/2-oxoglutarate dehydrogenase complex dihydrolipoamide acyltransferase (E2) component